MSIHVTLAYGRGVSRDGQGLPVYDSNALGYATRASTAGQVGSLEVPNVPGQVIARIKNIGSTAVTMRAGPENTGDDLWPMSGGDTLDLFVRPGDKFFVAGVIAS